MDEMTIPPVSDYMEPTDTVMRTSPSATLGSALNDRITTHESVLVFDENDVFTGIVSPYKTLYNNRYPQDAKVQDTQFTPPRITQDMPVTKAIAHMMALRVYTLPVFDGQKAPDGVIRAKHIARSMIADDQWLDMIASAVTPSDPITIRDDALVKDVHSVLRIQNIARLIVVDSQGKVVGIITRSDLGDALLRPTPKQRFSQRSGTAPGQSMQAKQMMFVDEKQLRQDAPIKPYMSTRVFSQPAGTPMREILRTMMDKDYSSIVLLDEAYKPQGFISMRDVLKAIQQLEQSESVAMTIKWPEHMTDLVRTEVEEKLRVFGEKMARRVKFTHLDIHIEEVGKTDGSPLRYDVHVGMVGMPGRDLRASGSHKRAITATVEAIKKLERQVRSSTSDS